MPSTPPRDSKDRVGVPEGQGYLHGPWMGTLDGIRGSSSFGAALDMYSHQKTTTATPWSYPPSGGQRRVRRDPDDPGTQRSGVEGGNVRRQRQR
eukprot:scaffold1072_cov460-Pavlova_lutheri.AAC.1